MKKLYSLLVATLATMAAISQTTNWTGAISTDWQVAGNWSSGVPVANTGIATFNTGSTISVTNAPNITLGGLIVTGNTSVTISKPTAGGVNTLTIANTAAASDFSIAAGSSLALGNEVNITLGNGTAGNPTTGSIAGTFDLNDRTYNTNGTNVVTNVTGSAVVEVNTNGAVTSTTATELTFATGTTYLHARDAGTIPTATWNLAGMSITGVTGTLPTGLNQAFGNVTWNCPSQTGEETFGTDMDDINGDFTVTSTGAGSIRYSNSSVMTINIDGDVTINGGLFRLANQATAGIKTLNIGGDFIQGGGTFDPDGNATTVAHVINVAGNWTRNAGTFNPDATTVVFNGGAAQAIGGTQATTFTNLTINNGNGVSIGNDVTTTGTLALTNGLLTTSATNILTMNAGSTYTGGNTDVSFVDGPMAKIGNTVFTFPVGKSGAGLRTIAISAPTASSTFTAEFLRTNPHTAVGSNIGSGLVQISYCEYWTLDRVGTGNASVTLSWASGSNCGGGTYVGNLATLRVAHWDGTTWVNEGQASNTGTTTAGTVTTGAALTSFSPFSLGTSAADNPLPVMFSNVKAYQKNSGVQIEWSNLTERDLVNYVVERSTNGQTYSAINQQLPRSNANEKESYSFYDATPFAGVNFYRIKVLEIGGKVIYSKILKVDMSGSIGFTLYPNPVVKGGQVSVGITGKQGQYTIKVINAAGQEVYNQRIAHQGGSMTEAIELPAAIKSGVYNMVISGGNYRESKTFVVQ